MDELEVGEYIYDSDRKVWTVRLEDTDVGDSYFDCKTQFEAEVLSRLVKLGHVKVKFEKVEPNISQVTIKVEKDKVTKTGLHCYNCGENTREEWLREDGMYYYRCQHCIDTADPNEPEPCPKCGCKAHEKICNSGPLTDEGLAKLHQDISNPFRPEFEYYTCLNCGHEYYTKAYVAYLATKAVREATKKQEKG